MNNAAIKQYQDGEIIVRQGDTEKTLYKILSGNVALYIDYDTPEEYLVGIRSFPHCFGEMTILANQPGYYTVVALGDTSILTVPEGNFEDFIKNNYQNAIMIMKTIAKNLTLLDLNLNMLLDEIRSISQSEQTDTSSLRQLAERYAISEWSIPAKSDAAVQTEEDAEELERAEEILRAGRAEESPEERRLRRAKARAAYAATPKAPPKGAPPTLDCNA